MLGPERQVIQPPVAIGCGWVDVRIEFADRPDLPEGLPATKLASRSDVVIVTAAGTAALTTGPWVPPRSQPV